MEIKKIKIVMVLLLFIIIINTAIPVHAVTIDDIWIQGSNFISMGKSNTEGTFNGEKLKDATDSLYNLFLWAGIVIAVIVGAFLGVKFMTESVEGKAKIKEALIPFCIGCVIIFGGFTIWRIAMKTFGEIEEVELTVAGNQKSCLAGNHEFDNLLDETCNNNCGESHKHLLNLEGTPRGGSFLKCKICGLLGPDISKCGHTYGRGEYAGICTNCGAKCLIKTSINGHYNMPEYTRATSLTHECTMCGASEKHTFNIQTGNANTCTTCGYKCIHKPKVSGNNRYIECEFSCGFNVGNCKDGTGGAATRQHTYETNPQRAYCTYCCKLKDDYSGCKHWLYGVTGGYSGGPIYTCNNCKTTFSQCTSGNHVYVQSDGKQFCIKCYGSAN